MANYSKQVKPTINGNYKKLKIALVVAKWNEDITNAMEIACKETLISNGVLAKNIASISVPCSFEIPYAANLLAQNNKVDVVICFGCIIKGETIHDEVLAYSVTEAIQQLNTLYDIPFVLGVLTTNNLKQASERVNGKKGNKGADCAAVALHMSTLGNTCISLFK